MQRSDPLRILFVCSYWCRHCQRQGNSANADLAGAVKGADGALLPGVTVTATNEASGLIRTSITSSKGSYVLLGLKPGTYTVSFALDGFRSLQDKGVQLRVGQESRLDVTLQVGLEEIITVLGEAPASSSSTRRRSAAPSPRRSSRLSLHKIAAPCYSQPCSRE